MIFPWTNLDLVRGFLSHITRIIMFIRYSSTTLKIHKTHISVLQLTIKLCLWAPGHGELSASTRRRRSACTSPPVGGLLEASEAMRWRQACNWNFRGPWLPWLIFGLLWYHNYRSYYCGTLHNDHVPNIMVYFHGPEGTTFGIWWYHNYLVYYHLGLPLIPVVIHVIDYHNMFYIMECGNHIW